MFEWGFGDIDHMFQFLSNISLPGTSTHHHEQSILQTFPLPSHFSISLSPLIFFEIMNNILPNITPNNSWWGHGSLHHLQQWQKYCYILQRPQPILHKDIFSRLLMQIFYLGINLNWKMKYIYILQCSKRYVALLICTAPVADRISIRNTLIW